MSLIKILKLKETKVWALCFAALEKSPTGKATQSEILGNRKGDKSLQASISLKMKDAQKLELVKIEYSGNAVIYSLNWFLLDRVAKTEKMYESSK